MVQGMEEWERINQNQNTKHTLLKRRHVLEIEIEVEALHSETERR